MKQLSRFIFMLSLILLVTACEKELIVEPDNNVPDYSKVPTVKIRNYVNRIFIDLIGREPTNPEMDLEVGKLRNANLSENARKELIEQLMFSTIEIPGDTTYQIAYYRRIYELSKIRFIEGASEADILSERNMLLNRYISDSLSGNMEAASQALLDANKMLRILDGRVNYMDDNINIMELCGIMVDNAFYDFINMNSFNFVNACFSDLLFRFPTTAEFQTGFEMVEDDIAGVLFQTSGNNKADFIHILIQSREAHQGMIIWTYNTLLARQPNTIEINKHLSDFFTDKNLQKLQTSIMISDEYANF